MVWKIEFSKLPDLQEKLLVDVVELYRETTFENLFRKLYTDEEEITRKTKAMYEIYSPEKEKQYGILGIKIKINVDDLKENLERFIPYNEQEEVERKIVICRYYKYMTQSKTAEVLGMSQVQISRAEKKILQKLRIFLE